jgi:hypothetical protein
LVIGVIVKLVSNKSETSVSVSITRARRMSELAKKYGVERVYFNCIAKKGWLSSRALRIFDVIESVCVAYTDQMRKMISDLESTDDNATNVEEINKRLYANYEAALTRAERVSSGALNALNKKIQAFDVPNSDIARKRSALVTASEKDEWGCFGEDTEKSIIEIDNRLNDLESYKNAFKGIGKDLQELQRRAKELEKKKPNLMSKVSSNMSSEIVSDVIKYVEGAHAILKESSDAIYAAIKYQIEDDEAKTKGLYIGNDDDAPVDNENSDGDAIDFDDV